MIISSFRHDVCLLTAACLLSVSGCAGGLSRGRLAPDFSLKNADGSAVTLNDYRGQVVLLAYWAAG